MIQLKRVYPIGVVIGVLFIFIALYAIFNGVSLRIGILFFTGGWLINYCRSKLKILGSQYDEIKNKIGNMPDVINLIIKINETIDDYLECINSKQSKWEIQNKEFLNEYLFELDEQIKKYGLNKNNIMQMINLDKINSTKYE